MKPTQKLLLRVVTSCLIGVAGCGGGERPDFDLLDGQDTPPAENPKAEHARLRQLQLVDGKLNAPADCSNRTADGGLLELLLGTSEYEVLSTTVGEPYDGSSTDCYVTWTIETEADAWAHFVSLLCQDQQQGLALCGLRDAAESICIAHQLREAANPRKLQTVSGSAGSIIEHVTITIDPQFRGARVSLLNKAREHSQKAAVSALDGIKAEEFSQQDASGDPCGTASQYASTFVEAYHYYNELTEEAVDAVVAVADAQRSWSSSVQQGVQWSVGGIPNPDPKFGNLSRSKAAHMLVGGDPGLYLDGAPVGGFCTSPQLSGQAQKAIRLIREAAPDPKAILAMPGAAWLGNNTPVDIDTLVNGSLQSGSIRERLTPRYPDLGTQAYSTGIEPFFKLEQADFVEARKYLAEEIRAFARSLDAVETEVGTDICQQDTDCDTGISCQTRNECWADGTPCTTDDDCAVGECIPGLCELPLAEQRFVATARNPQPMPPVYWSTLAMRGAQDGWYDIYTLRPDLQFVTNLITFTDAVISEAQVILDDPSFINDTSDRDEIVNVLTLLAEEGVQSRSQRVYYVSEWQPGVSRIWVFGVSTADNVRVVIGEDQLRCATAGSIEGAPCEVGGVALDQADSASDLPDWDMGAYGDFNSAGQDGERWYVLKPRQANDVRPGGFDAIAGGFVDATTTDSRFVPVISRVWDRAADVLRPSRKWCTHQKVTCAGTDFDERLPLENELSDDGDNVESSWRHFLTLARDAADEADALGQEYIAAGLDLSQRQETLSIREQDQRLRAESELEELQDICGTAIEAGTLLKMLSVPSSGEPQAEGSDSDLSAIRATSAGCTSCKAGQFCLMGTCVWDPVLLAINDPENPDLSRLAECIGNARDVAYVTPGNSPLCFYLANGNPNYPCQNAEAQCPVLPGGAAEFAYQNSHPWDPAHLAASIDYAKSQCAATLEVPAGNNPIDVAIPLGYFDSVKKPVAVTKKDWACDAVRQLRYGLNNGMSDAKRDSLMATIVGSSVFTPDNVESVANAIGWVPNHESEGGGSTITFNGAPKASTADGLGLLFWPCGKTCPSGRDGLMCYDCLDANGALVDTEELDRRLGRAAIAAKVITTNSGVEGGRYVDGIDLPVYYYPTSDEEQFKLDNAFVAPDGREVYQGHALPLSDTDCIPFLPPSDYKVDNLNERISQPCLYLDIYNALPGVPSEAAWGSVLTLDGNGGVFSLARNALSTVGKIYEGLGAPWPDVDLFGGLYSQGTVIAENVDPGWLRRVYEGTQDGSSGIPGYFGGDQSRESLLAYERIDWSTDPLVESIISAESVLSEESILDAAELICEMSDIGGYECNLLNPPEMKTVADLDKAKAHLECMADDMEVMAGYSIFANVPQRAIGPLRVGGGTGSYPAVGGEIGAAISRLREELIHISEIVPMAAHEVRLLGNDIEAVKLFVDNNDLDESLINLDRLSGEMAETARCKAAQSKTISETGTRSQSASFSLWPPVPSVSVSSSWSKGTSWNPGAAAATCANTTSQIQFAIDRAAREQAKLDNSVESQFNEFQKSFETRSATLFGYAQELKKSAEEIDAKLAEIEGLRKKAERALYRALFVSSFQAENQEQISAAMRARKDVTKVRYDRAFDNAQRTAFLAKRAIEQRLGFHLSEMRTDLPLVEAPSKWEAEVCTLSGLDYSSFENADGTQANTDAISKQFIGDYVTRLENLVESYQLTYNFHEGADTAIISLRDDVEEIRAECDVESKNMLYYSAEPDFVVASDSQAPGWRLANCAEETIEQGSGSIFEGVLTTAPIPDCITLLPHDDAAPEDVEGTVTPVQDPYFGTVTMYDVYFGLDGTPCTDECGYRADSELYQDVALEAGTYRLSWYGDDDQGAAVHDLVRLVEADPAARGTVLDTNPSVQDVTENGVHRNYYTVQVASAVDARVIVTQPTTGSAWSLGGLMLEDISGQLSADLGPFAETGGTLTRRLPVCEDTDGDVFRRTAWTQGCARLCANGFEGECSGSNAETHCYWETSFSINQRAIESNEQLVQSGFARGNFNYRIDSIGVNFVGAGSRDCENSDTPSTCYAGGFIPYSLRQQGPYFVRNHLGQQFEAKLFSGNIEHARGLGAERYLSSPLSDTDRSLIEPYLREEFSGRPLDGNYSLRVWNEPGVDFDAIQDAQIVLNYRYWTRFD